ncbi:hypothetical protein SODALDRAFT_328356 [Sodiomyces alkalinus F11]|uniref:J domain-containing protein n=1 Tax=Sodiomyces alkalinus (strain CBS 110278 / VKM F-3762 / F11) TaxID=1314773 RepID=A0A3N2PNQ4_SODAK|nr:hypothetical protein SODALDRAFT_328356 [Sodiomyces alkalinus F11]ROT35976.1 hypothetical protein SODALDRAFT_328356 [Sodiomyces alkalinus F11]
MTNPSSPRRRHILSSINPDRGNDPGADAAAKSHRRHHTKEKEHSRAKSPVWRRKPEDKHEREEGGEGSSRRRETKESKKRDYGDSDANAAEESRSRSNKRFRFKFKKGTEEESSSSHKKDHGDSHQHRHRHRHRHRRHHRSESPTAADLHDRPLSPNTAFRESLFDAMADDEGAAYWEAVYGQPVHIYGNAGAGGEPKGKLESMDEEEYAAYVRRKMWEKTYAGLLEEGARRQAARKQREEEEKRQEREERRRDKVRREVEETLRRGEERKTRKKHTTRWRAYLDAWRRWESKDAKRNVADLPWPVESGRREDVRQVEGEVRRFFLRGLEAADIAQGEFAARLKDERVRWHPDKVQQRTAGGQVEPAVMQDVTAVFQIVDALWSETRKKGR